MKTKLFKGYQINKYLNVSPNCFGDRIGKLVIAVMPEVGDAYISSDKCFEFAWQCNLNGEQEQQDWGWYGFRCNIQSSIPETIVLAAKMVKQLYASDGHSFSDRKPETVIEYLKKHGYVEVVYHSGTSRYYRTTKAPQDATWATKLPGSNYYGAIVVARDEIEALRLLKKEAKRQTSLGYDVDGWNAWLKNPSCFQHQPTENLGPVSLAIHEENKKIAC